MALRHGWVRWGASLLVAITTMAVTLIGGTATSASAAGPTNTPPSGLNLCDPNSSAISRACLAGALSDFARARAKEGLPPMVLPANFLSMSVSNQLFTLVNIERHDRGLPLFVANAPNLLTYVVAAANAALDPLFPSWTKWASGDWAGTANSLWADYVWMYYDGLNTDNLSCTLLIRIGCWGHRKSILGTYAAPRILAAASGLGGVAMLLMSGDLHDWNLLTPNAPRRLQVQQLADRRVLTSWSSPPQRGTAIRGYYIKRDDSAWIRVRSLSRTTAVPLQVGYHVIQVRSFNARGPSPIRTVHIMVR